MEWLHELLHNGTFVWCAMAVIIFVLTQGLKQFIKLGTKHIKNERTRKIVNTTILLIPFGLGILLDFVYSTYYLQQTFSIMTGLGYGTASISLYAAIERGFKDKTKTTVKIENPYDTEEGKAVTELIENITADGKVDSADKTAVEEFLEKLNKE